MRKTRVSVARESSDAPDAAMTATWSRWCQRDEETVMRRNLKAVVITAVCAAACCHSALAQGLLPTILEVDIENLVEYQNDISDPSRFGTNPNITPSAGIPEFGSATVLGDIVRR